MTTDVTVNLTSNIDPSMEEIECIGTCSNSINSSSECFARVSKHENSKVNITHKALDKMYGYLSEDNRCLFSLSGKSTIALLKTGSKKIQEADKNNKFNLDKIHFIYEVGRAVFEQEKLVKIFYLLKSSDGLKFKFDNESVRVKVSKIIPGNTYHGMMSVFEFEITYKSETFDVSVEVRSSSGIINMDFLDNFKMAFSNNRSKGLISFDISYFYDFMSYLDGKTYIIHSLSSGLRNGNSDNLIKGISQIFKMKELDFNFDYVENITEDNKCDCEKHQYVIKEDGVVKEMRSLGVRFNCGHLLCCCCILSLDVQLDRHVKCPVCLSKFVIKTDEQRIYRGAYLKKYFPEWRFHDDINCQTEDGTGVPENDKDEYDKKVSETTVEEILVALDSYGLGAPDPDSNPAPALDNRMSRPDYGLDRMGGMSGGYVDQYGYQYRDFPSPVSSIGPQSRYRQRFGRQRIRGVRARRNIPPPEPIRQYRPQSLQRRTITGERIDLLRESSMTPPPPVVSVRSVNNGGNNEDITIQESSMNISPPGTPISIESEFRSDIISRSRSRSRSRSLSSSRCRIGIPPCLSRDNRYSNVVSVNSASRSGERMMLRDILGADNTESEEENQDEDEMIKRAIAESMITAELESKRSRNMEKIKKVRNGEAEDAEISSLESTDTELPDESKENNQESKEDSEEDSEEDSDLLSSDSESE